VLVAREEIERTARERLGFESLRPGQAEAIEAVLEGRDCLAVMATGYGKSAIYQIAALLMDGPTVVVSPLIALQRDQLEDLADEGAAAVNSTVGEAASRAALEAAEAEMIEFVFMAPEQLAKDEVIDELRAAQPSLFVVDEAHCISEWGHDFRPAYLRLGAAAEEIGRPRMLALTATASPPVREEIVTRLGLRDPAVLVRGFNRENIRLSVESFRDERRKREALLERVAEAAKPGIVYCATRKTTEEVAEELRERGVRAEAYHAGMAGGKRDDVQARFMDDELAAIVATTAFGMGVDKPNVRFVMHHDVADSVDSYYQEVGRSGRDGEHAEAVLFYRPEDLGIRRFFAGSGQVALDEIEAVAAAVQGRADPVDPVEIRERTELSETKLMTALSRLEDVGAVRILPTGRVAPDRDHGDLREAAVEAAEKQEEREQFDRSRVEMIRGYAELDHGCRREYILSYFGEDYRGPCGNCDNCEAGRVASREEEPWPRGSRVEHREWGPGVVQRYENGAVVVLFDSVGYKRLGVDLVTKSGVLAEL
jgi:ATP-dependent DNA helicase RecQ